MNYITILDFMVNDLKLKGNELIIYALIYGFCQDSSSVFYGSQQYIMERTGVSNYTVNDILKKLTERELVIKSKENIHGVNKVFYKINYSLLNMGESHTTVRNPHFGCEKTSHNNKDNNKVYKEKSIKKESFYEEIDKYTDDLELRKLLKCFVDMRLSDKKDNYTIHALNIGLSRLTKLSKDNQNIIDVVSRTIEYGWKSFYKIDNNQNNNASSIKTDTSPDEEYPLL